MEARREGRLRQEPQVQAARRAGLAAWPAARSSRSTASSGSRSPTTQTQVNALLAGEIDFIEAPPHDLLPLLRSDTNIKLVDWNPLGSQYTFRFNALHKPFDNPKVRQAVALRLQPEGLPQGRRSAIRKYYKVCKRCFLCGTPLATDKGMDDMLEVELRQGAGSC